jgi:L-glutamine-phosphate cytidylyltransferase
MTVRPTIRRAIILSAGQGSRLLPLTASRPKCLIAVGGKAILDHQLDALFAAGIEEAVIVTGYLNDQIAVHVKPRGHAVRTIINPNWASVSSIGSLWVARDFLSDGFIVMNGDTVYEPAILQRAIADAYDGVNLLVETLTDGADHDDMRVSVVDGAITAVAKTLPDADATHRSLGVILVQHDDGAYAAMLDTIYAEPDGSGAFHHSIIDRLAKVQAVHPVDVHAAHWQEIDRPEDMAGWHVGA